MASAEDDRAALVLVERHIAEIEERICALKAVIKKVKAAGGNARNQSQLLSDMGTALGTIAAFRAKMLSAPSNRG